MGVHGHVRGEMEVTSMSKDHWISRIDNLAKSKELSERALTALLDDILSAAIKGEKKNED